MKKFGSPVLPALGKDYYVRSKVSGKVLDIAGGYTENRTNIHQWAKAGVPNQIWQLEDAGDGYYYLISKNSSSVAAVDIYDFNVNYHEKIGSSEEQKWKLENAGEKWKLEYAGDGYFYFVNKLSGKVLDVENSGGENGTNVQQYERNGTDAQKWKFEAADTDASILGVGTDNQLYIRDTLASPWVKVPNNGSLLTVTVLPTEQILGVGTDNQLYIQDTLTSPWVQVPNSGSVIDVIANSEQIVGVGIDNQLYTRDTLTSPWVKVPNSGLFINVALLSNTIFGVGTDNQLYGRDTLTSPWVKVPSNLSLLGVTAFPNGTILGVSKDNELYTQDTLTSSWVKVPNSGSVINVAVAI
jgi:hypothetical protein